MYARVARWEGGDPESIRAAAQRINEDAGSGPPEGVPAKGFTLLTDPDGGQALAIVLFDSEDDYRKGDETLNSMNPPDDGMGKRASVTKFEVAVDVRI